MATIRTVVEICNRDERPAVATRIFSIDGDWFELPVCEEHDAMFDRQFSPWRISAEAIDAPVKERRSEFFKAEDIAAGRRIAELREKEASKVRAQSFAERRAIEIEKEMQTKAEEIAWNVIPGAKLWTVTKHARDRMAEYDIDLDQVLLAATIPDVVLKGQDGKHTQRRGDTNIVVNPTEYVVITVLKPGAASAPAPRPTERIAL